MMNENNSAKDQWIDKLIRFFRRMPRKAPDADRADYSGWHQTEEEYQKEQAEWLKTVKERKRKPGHNKSKK